MKPEEIANDIVTTLTEQTAKDVIKMKLTKATKLDIKDSKISGIPYIPSNIEYPTDEIGNNMKLLIQINFAQIPHIKDYPTKGILQIFIANDDYFGLDFTKPKDQTNWKILYHEDIDKPYTEYNHKFEINNTPFVDIDAQYKLDFVHSVEAISACDRLFDETLISNCWKIMEDNDIVDPLFMMPPNISTNISNKLNGFGSKIGGYPGFTQYDIRPETSDYELFIQIDSEMIDNEYILLWGDVGIANFFIRKEDLINKNFNNVIYNWDCY